MTTEPNALNRDDDTGHTCGYQCHRLVPAGHTPDCPRSLPPNQRYARVLVTIDLSLTIDDEDRPWTAQEIDGFFDCAARDRLTTPPGWPGGTPPNRTEFISWMEDSP